MAGYFGGMGGASPGMGMLMSPYASQINPQALAMMAAAQNGGQGQPPGGGAAPQLPPVQKAMSNAGATPSMIPSQPQNPMISQLMQNPQALANLLRQMGGGMGGAGNQPGAFGSSWLTPNMAQGAWNSMGGGY